MKSGEFVRQWYNQLRLCRTDIEKQIWYQWIPLSSKSDNGIVIYMSGIDDY